MPPKTKADIQNMSEDEWQEYIASLESGDPIDECLPGCECAECRYWSQEAARAS